MKVDERIRVVTRVSAIGIAVNLASSAIKIALGVLASSIAIVSEGVNSATDVLTSALTLIGAKLSRKHPDARHPFGYGRLEYVTALVVSVVIFMSGLQVLIESVKLAVNPQPLAISYVSIIVIGALATVKLLLGVYTLRSGRRVNSDALIGVGLDCRGDALASLITIFAALVFIVTGVSVDAYAGMVMAAIIFKSGAEVFAKTASELIGRAGEKALATKLYAIIRSTPGIAGAADMMLHNYGPGAWSGSVNVEIAHDLTVGDAYRLIHELQLKIMHEEKVTLVFGVYAVGDDRGELPAVRKAIARFVRSHEGVKSYHAVYLEPKTGKLYCDIIVDYSLRDWDRLRGEFVAYIGECFPGREVELTVETEFV